MPENNPQITEFLARNGLEGAEREALRGDASHRHYQRIIKNNQKFILMIAPPDKEDIRPFIKIDNILREAGFSAPEIIASDLEYGLLLLEDLGDDLFSRILADKIADERQLYFEAVKLLAKLPKKADLPPYSEEKLLAEASLLTEWHLTQANSEEYLKIWRELLAKLDNSQQVLVLRDYHADNLIWLPGNRASQRIGLLDFQDAVIGHPAYDLVSLLEDARRDVDKNIVGEVLKTKNGKFLRDYFILGAQRNCKIIGIFNRLHKCDGKSEYLKYLPRVWAHLRADLQHPALGDLKMWIEKNAQT